MSNIDLKPHIKRLGNNDYVMVSGRVLLAHEDNDALTIETEMLVDDENRCIFRATVTTRKGTFTGSATSDKNKKDKYGKPALEAVSPVEIAETSAIGRALGFAGYGAEYGIASADEMARVNDNAPQEPAQARSERLANKAQRDEILQLATASGTSLDTLTKYYGVAGLQALTEQQASHAIGRLQRKTAPQEVEA